MIWGFYICIKSSHQLSLSNLWNDFDRSLWNLFNVLSSSLQGFPLKCALSVLPIWWIRLQTQSNFTQLW